MARSGDRPQQLRKTLPERGGIIGLAFALAGLHLVYKNIDPIVMPLATILLFLTGALSSLEGIPILYPLSRFLPLSIGIDLMRSLLVAGHPLSQLVTEPAFYGLLLNSAVYLFAGLAILNWAHKKARDEGSLAPCSGAVFGQRETAPGCGQASRRAAYFAYQLRPYSTAPCPVTAVSHFLATITRICTKGTAVHPFSAK